MNRFREQPLIWYIGVQTLLLVLFYWPWLSGASSYYFRDITHYVEPFCRFTAQSLRAGELPLWNPWFYCGMPQLAVTIHSFLYAPTWLFVLVPFAAALASNMILHQVICGIGGFLLISSFGWGRLPAIICGATLAMSGYMFSLTSNFSLVVAAAWCPLSLWALQEVGKPDAPKKIVLRTAVAAGCVAMLTLSGHPEILIIEFVLFSALIGWRAFSGRRANDPDWKTGLFSQLRALLLGVLFAMPMILPACEWLAISRRSGGMIAGESLILSANWYDLLCLIVPQPLGDLQQRWAEFRPLVMPGSMVPWLPSAFVGPVVFTLALWSLSDRTWKQRALMFFLLVIVLLLALGVNTPLAPFLLGLFPSLSFIRFPVKLLFFAVWCLSVLAARGLYLCLEGRAPVSISFIWWGSVAVIGILLFGEVHIADLFLKPHLVNSATIELAHRAEHAIGVAALIAAAIGLVISGCGYLCKRRLSQLKPLPLLIVLASVGCSLFYALMFCHHGVSPSFFQERSLAATELEKLKNAHNKGETGRMVGLFMERFSIPPSYLSKDAALATIQMYQYSRQLLRPNTNLDFEQPSSFGFEGTATGDYYYYWLNSYLKSTQAFAANPSKSADDTIARLCQLTATRYAITQVYRFADNGMPVAVPLCDQKFFRLAYENQPMNVRIYTVSDSLSRAYFSNSWIWSDSHTDVLEKMFNPAISGFDPTQATLIERPDQDQMNPLPESASHSMSSGTSVQFLEDGINSVKLNVQAPVDGFVVLADQHYPGWVATVDERQSPILVANCFTRAVFVPAGRHIVKFTYQPVSLLQGIILCGISFFWLLYLGYREQRATDESEKPV